MRITRSEDILKATEPEQVFGKLEAGDGETQSELLRTVFQGLARVFHPDLLKKPSPMEIKKSNDVMGALINLRERAEKKLAAGTYGQIKSITIKAKNTYTDVIPLCAGDISDLYTGYYQPNNTGPAKRVLIKVARSVRDADLLANEMRVLTTLHALKGKEDPGFQRYLPRPIEATTLTVGGKARPTNILTLTKDSYTLAEVRRAYPQGIDAADMAWMWRRNLELLSWVHAQGYVHGAVVPSHVFIHPGMHGGRLIDWSYAVKIGERVKAISSEHANFYPPEILSKDPATPATDIFMSAKCAFYVLKLERAGKTTGSSPGTPIRVLGLLRACRLSRPSARYGSAQEVYAEFDAILREAYGPPAFRPFEMPSDFPVIRS